MKKWLGPLNKITENLDIGQIFFNDNAGRELIYWLHFDTNSCTLSLL